MSHELKELSSQEVDLVAGGSGLSPSQIAATTMKDHETPQTLAF